MENAAAQLEDRMSEAPDAGTQHFEQHLTEPQHVEAPSEIADRAASDVHELESKSEHRPSARLRPNSRRPSARSKSARLRAVNIVQQSPTLLQAETPVQSQYDIKRIAAEEVRRRQEIQEAQRKARKIEW